MPDVSIARQYNAKYTPLRSSVGPDISNHNANRLALQRIMRKIAGDGKAFITHEFRMIPHFVMDGVYVLCDCIQDRDCLQLREARDVISITRESVVDAPKYDQRDMDSFFGEALNKEIRREKVGEEALLIGIQTVVGVGPEDGYTKMDGGS
ncbi:hypothetical protein D9619_013216 [Psilocybe cf. subviscida]|uniref:Uncharacterized protein n=1 Tax=Psilocybe cf. subviscida TaxID=2480587 RepID=A0A8H5B6K6_9AGAR|nr:hypothetical protein D9619_013216 [Psilocybe cf. subviscida]